MFDPIATAAALGVAPATLRDWMDRHAAAQPQAIACIGPEGRLDYATLHARALAQAAALRRLGIGKGDVVAIQLPNGLAFLQTYLATGYAGAVLQTIHMPYRAAEIEPLLRHGRAKAVVCLAQGKDESPAALMLSLRDRLPDLQTVIAVGPGAPEGTDAFDSVTADPADLIDGPAPDDPFVLLYTSGTTAAPKGVPVPYRKFLANAWLSAPELEVDRDGILMSAAPFSHLYGLFSINVALAAGAAVALLPAITPAALADALDACRPTGLFVAPAHCAAGLKEGLFTAERLASLRFILISGSVCPPELARTVQDLMPNGKVCQLWGMSEMQAGTYTRLRDPETARLTTAGRSSPGTELRIADGTTPLPAGTEGELQARGISVFDGYLDNPDATAAAFTRDGWFRTGDLARMDQDGFIELTGRTKDVINRGGVKFNPADVEAVIGQHPDVESCAIVPMPDPVLGEKACCFVVARGGARPDLDGLRNWLDRHAIAKNKWPERVELIAEMPMTPTRKIRKAELVRMLGERG